LHGGKYVNEDEIDADKQHRTIGVSGQELATSRAFIQWYQKLLAYRAGETMTGVNAQISKLGNALPTAAKILEAAMAEADAAAVA